ncbi:MAG: hypothetical protein WBO37_07660 [Gammaproteobacteria bacterium]
MATGKLTLACDGMIGEILCIAIREYAHAAYPPGGSDCAQVARYTLLELANQIETGSAGAAGVVEISRRPRAMIRAAVQYHFDRADAEHDAMSVHQRALFDELLREVPVTRERLEAALAADRASRPVAT